MASMAHQPTSLQHQDLTKDLWDPPPEFNVPPPPIPAFIEACRHHQPPADKVAPSSDFLKSAFHYALLQSYVGQHQKILYFRCWPMMICCISRLTWSSAAFCSWSYSPWPLAHYAAARWGTNVTHFKASSYTATKCISYAQRGESCHYLFSSSQRIGKFPDFIRKRVVLKLPTARPNGLLDNDHYFTPVARLPTTTGNKTASSIIVETLKKMQQQM